MNSPGKDFFSLIQEIVFLILLTGQEERKFGYGKGNYDINILQKKKSFFSAINTKVHCNHKCKNSLIQEAS